MESTPCARRQLAADRHVAADEENGSIDPSGSDPLRLTNSVDSCPSGKVKSQTPKVEPQEKAKRPKGRAHKREQYTRRFVNVTLAPGGKRKVRIKFPIEDSPDGPRRQRAMICGLSGWSAEMADRQLTTPLADEPQPHHLKWCCDDRTAGFNPNQSMATSPTEDDRFDLALWAASEDPAAQLTVVTLFYDFFFSTTPQGSQPLWERRCQTDICQSRIMGLGLVGYHFRHGNFFFFFRSR